MDPCPFMRIIVGGLALKFPVASKPTFSGVHPASSPCFCKIKLSNFPSQIASVPLATQNDPHCPATQAACFNLCKSQFDKLASKRHCVKIEIYTGRTGNTCGLSSGELLGKLLVPLDVKPADSKSTRTFVIQNGWASLKGSSTQLHLNVKAEPDPRFVFQFDGEPERSPQVFQVNGNNVRQPVFTCKFSFRNSGEHSLRSRSSVMERRTSKRWLNSLSSKTEQTVKERKGWSIMVHDLSGSPVAAASMVTPFVPSPGTDRVSRSNPGAWLILRPGSGTWNPWGRLEAWREPATHHLGYRFELLPDAASGGSDAVTLANSNLSIKNGGKFTIDVGSGSGSTPDPSPTSSLDLGSGSWADLMYQGFVMSSTVGTGAGKHRKSPEVEVGVTHVTCTEDAAAFVALAAAVELSVDACRPFSQKLRKELRQQKQELVV
ncbi:uncharacterized protein LOC127801214 [Diospyros lotus]|uniref:uncharacterized protein LOC127801214 n=1 Tax=Diospyros lotus TaxID=55363 RepID=UPI00224ED645|nr:uncharacterized protein LOC127801214 [Diospyros lotus]